MTPISARNIAAGQVRRGAVQFARLPPADPWRPAADGQLAEHLGVAGQPDGRGLARQSSSAGERSPGQARGWRWT